MSKTRKILLLRLSILMILSVVAYLAIPKIAQNVIISAIEQDGSVVQEVVVSWSGPQLLTGMHVEHRLGTADIDIEIADVSCEFLKNKVIGSHPTDHQLRKAVELGKKIAENKFIFGDDINGSEILMPYEQ